MWGILHHLPGIPITRKKKLTESRPIRRRDLAPKGQLTEVLNGPFMLLRTTCPWKAALSIRSAIQLAPSGLLERAKNDKGASDDHQAEGDYLYRP